MQTKQQKKAVQIGTVLALISIPVMCHAHVLSLGIMAIAVGLIIVFNSGMCK